MKRDRVIINNICIDIIHNGESCDKSALYLYGFPGSIGVNSLTEKLVESGTMVLQPHFPGTYDSSGEFDPFVGSEVINTIYSNNSQMCTSVKSGKKIFILKPKTIFGHSFGAYAALEGVHQAYGAEKLVLMAPAISFKTNNEGCGLIGEDVSHYDYVKRSRPYTYRLNARERFEAMYSGQLEERNRFAPSSLKKVVGIIGADDKYFDLELISKNFNAIVQKELVGTFDIDFHIIPGATHSLNTLITHSEVS